MKRLPKKISPEAEERVEAAIDMLSRGSLKYLEGIAFHELVWLMPDGTETHVFCHLHECGIIGYTLDPTHPGVPYFGHLAEVRVGKRLMAKLLKEASA